MQGLPWFGLYIMGLSLLCWTWITGTFIMSRSLKRSEISGELAITPGRSWHARGEKKLGSLRDEGAPRSESEEQSSMSFNWKRRRNRLPGLLFDIL